ncbi:MAG TPA: hypothetical protein VF708_06640 [Pyrinomonadaceae bacterium]
MPPVIEAATAASSILRVFFNGTWQGAGGKPSVSFLHSQTPWWLNLRTGLPG